MTREYAEKQIEIAREEVRAARKRVDTAKTKKAQQRAYDDLEFWSNKAAFFYGILAANARFDD